MRRPARYLFLKILAFAAVYLFIHSGTLILRSLLFDTDGGIYSQILSLFIFAAGISAGLLNVHAGYLRPWLKIAIKTVLILTLFLPPGLCIAFYGSHGFWRVAMEAVVAILVYVVSFRFSGYSPAQIMSNATAITGTIVLMICLLAVHFLENQTGIRHWIFASIYIFMFSFLIVRNQQSLDSNIISRKRVDKSKVPRNLRRLNIILVCLIFAGLVLLLNLNTFVAFVSQTLGQFIIFMIKTIIAIIVFLFSREEKPMGQEPQAMEPGFLGDEAAAGMHPFINILFTVIMCAIFAYVGYKILRILIRKLPDLMQKIVNLFKRLLAVRPGDKIPETSEYSDEVEWIKPVRSDKRKRRIRIKIGKISRGLEKIKDPAEKIKHMYGVILRSLPSIGVRPEKYDTTIDIADKVVGTDVSEGLIPFTLIFNRVRYGDALPGTDMVQEAGQHFDGVIKAVNEVGTGTKFRLPHLG